MLLCADEEAAAAALASGVLSCPSCKGGRLRAWGWGRERAIRVPGGTRQLRPRRGRCRSCGATHVLLPAWTVPRRADSTATIAAAAALSALDGIGTARLGARLGVPAATVRGWLRRLRSRAGQLLQETSCEFGRLVAIVDDEGRDPSPPGPTGIGAGRRPGPGRRVRPRSGPLARPPGRKLRGAAGPVRPGCRPRARPGKLILSPVPGAAMPGTRPRRSP
jgi:transposase-like protein